MPNKGKQTYNCRRPYQENFLADFLGLSSESESTTRLENNVKNFVSTSQVNEIINTCVADQSAQNVTRISNIRGSTIEGIDLKNMARNQCRMNALAKALEDSGASQKLIDDIQKSQETSGLFTNSTDTTEMINNVKNTITSDQLNSILNNCKAKQDTSNIVEITDISDSFIGGIKHVNEAYNECIQDAVAGTEAKKRTSTESEKAFELSQKTTTPIVSEIADVFNLGNIFEGSGEYIVIIVIAIVIIAAVGGGIFLMMNMGGSGASKPGSSSKPESPNKLGSPSNVGEN